MALNWDAEVLAPVMAVFGEGVAYRPQAGTPFTLTDAVFDAQYAYVQRDKDGNEVTTTSPMLGVRRSSCPVAPLQSDRLTIQATGQEYIVKDVRPDSHGHIVLLLNTAKPRP